MTRSPHFDLYVASCVKSGGIYHYQIHDGSVRLAGLTRMDRPMYMVVENRKMYIVLREPFASGESGVVVYDLEDAGRLVNPSGIQSTRGKVACHIMVNRGEVYCANYISGSLIGLPDRLVQHVGHGTNPVRQEGPHVHFVGMTPDEQYVCATDLGLDTIFLYDRDLTVHTAVKVPAGHGVRHLAFSEDGRWLFAVNELQSTVAAFAYHDGDLELVDVCSAVPPSFQGETTAAAIRVKDGDIYVSNRGHDSIARLRFRDNRLSLADAYECGGKTPRDFVFAGDDLFCANQDGSCVTVLDGRDGFRIRDRIAVEQPVCVCVREHTG